MSATKPGARARHLTIGAHLAVLFGDLPTVLGFGCALVGSVIHQVFVARSGPWSGGVVLFVFGAPGALVAVLGLVQAFGVWLRVRRVPTIVRAKVIHRSFRPMPRNWHGGVADVRYEVEPSPAGAVDYREASDVRPPLVVSDSRPESFEGKVGSEWDAFRFGDRAVDVILLDKIGLRATKGDAIVADGPRRFAWLLPCGIAVLHAASAILNRGAT